MIATFRYCLFLFLLAIVLSGSVAAQTPSTVFQLLTPKEGAKMTLEVDLQSLMANKKTTNYIGGKVTSDDGKVFEVEIKARGKYRRKMCELPPLKVKFKKKALKKEGLDTLNEIKLVLPCFEDDRGDDLIVKEYLAYKMFESMTEACVKARLIKLTLIDSHIGKKHNILAMILEDEEETAARLKGQLIEQYGIPTDSLLINQAALVSMFEYMIGNTDWDVSMIRNVRTIKSPESGKIVLIPYDFDFSGLVSAPYATPSSESGLRNVRERFLIHNGIPQDALRKATIRLKSNKKEFYDLCRNRYLSRDGMNSMTLYLESFFLKADQTEDMPGTMPAPAAE